MAIIKVIIMHDNNKDNNKDNKKDNNNNISSNNNINYNKKVKIIIINITII